MAQYWGTWERRANVWHFIKALMNELRSIHCKQVCSIHLAFAAIIAQKVDAPDYMGTETISFTWEDCNFSQEDLSGQPTHYKYSDS